MTKGLIQPIVVRRSTEAPDKYIIMFGEKRFLACRRLGWERIPCIVNNPLGTELSPPPDLSDIVEHHPPERSEPYDTGDFGQEPENHT
jgi:ParB/RepB/Spo0J family partition protein